MKSLRCPNGTRKNKSGHCIQYVITDKKNTRCPNGTRKNKSGVCIQYVITDKKNTRKKKVIIDRQTPRSLYANKYFTNNKDNIHLLDKMHMDDTNVLFQVNYNDVNQFFNYENLHNNPKIDCFFQTIFSLGLQDVEISKKYSTNVNKYGKVGVSAAEVKIFIKNAFGLTEDERITFFTTNVGNYAKYKNRSSEFINNKIRNKFDNKLKDGYATVVMVTRLNDYNKEIGLHFIVIFKYNNQIYFFDPQKKTRKNKDVIFTSTYMHDVLIGKNGNISYFTIDNLNGPKPLINTTCPIQYI